MAHPWSRPRSTPAANGEHVVVWHSSAGLHCYDFAGRPVWSRDLGEFEHMWGYGSSPILYGDKVILNCGPGKRNFVTALSLKTGDTVWEREEQAGEILNRTVKILSVFFTLYQIIQYLSTLNYWILILHYFSQLYQWGEDGLLDRAIV